MEARDLYLAEVYDVGRNGDTRKPFGRVFFTKNKSLIFYAYDLHQQPGVKNSNAFLVWGQRGPGRKRTLSLGIFCQDSTAIKRWLLKVDDSKTLQQIDAVSSKRNHKTEAASQVGTRCWWPPYWLSPIILDRSFVAVSFFLGT